MILRKVRTRSSKSIHKPKQHSHSLLFRTLFFLSNKGWVLPYNRCQERSNEGLIWKLIENGRFFSQKGDRIILRVKNYERKTKSGAKSPGVINKRTNFFGTVYGCKGWDKVIRTSLSLSLLDEGIRGVRKKEREYLRAKWRRRKTSSKTPRVKRKIVKRKSGPTEKETLMDSNIVDDGEKRWS